MIFVVLGTQDKSFERLLKKIDEEILKGNIKDKVIVQAGSTKYSSENMEILDLIPMSKFNSYIKKSKYIITHGGVGTILDSLKMNKKIIAVPRLKEYGEHENNHQLEIIDEFVKEGYILGCKDLEKLDNILKQIKEFKPKRYKGNNKRMITIIEEFIDNGGRYEKGEFK